LAERGEAIKDEDAVKRGTTANTEQPEKFLLLYLLAGQRFRLVALLVFRRGAPSRRKYALNFNQLKGTSLNVTTPLIFSS